MTESVAEPIHEVVVDVNQGRLIRVLHLDDDSSLLRIAKQCLEMEAPIYVDTVTSVDEALAKLRKNMYDVIVSDYSMPGKDGLAFLRELRQNGNTTPFVMFTGKGREEVAIKALNLGANQYISKLGETETVYAELAHGITELAKARKTEEKQRQSEEKFRGLFEKANEGFIFFDVAGTILDLNQKAAEIAGKSKEEIVGKSFLDLGLISSKHMIALSGRLENRKKGRPLDKVEVEIEKENGERRTVEISSTPIRKESDPAAIGFLAIARDITERKKTERALAESEQKFRNLFEKAHDGLVLIGTDGRIIDMNEKATELAGLKKEEVIGKSFLKLGLVNWKNIPQLLGLLGKVFKKQPAGNFQIAIRRKTGELLRATI
jgi:PAS domain S-box-containing protein